MKKLKYVGVLKSGDSITSEEIDENYTYPVFGGNGFRGFCEKNNYDGNYVLIGRQGALCGNINYAKGQFWASEHAVVVSIIGKDETIWLGELLREMNLNQYSQSAAQPGLAVDKIKNLPIPVPPLQEQQAIVKYLDQKTTLIDELIAKKTQHIALLQEQRTALIKHAVTKGLNDEVEMKDSGIEWIGEIPSHWGTSKVKWELTFHNNRRVPIEADKRGDLQGDYPYYGASGIIDYVNNYIFDGTYILVGEDGANILSRSTPLAFIAEGQFWVNNHAHILKAKNLQDKYFALQIELNDFTTIASGSAQPKLTKEAIGDLLLVVPPISEQQAIVAYLDEQTALIDKIIAVETQYIASLKEYRQSLISAVVTGKICII